MITLLLLSSMAMANEDIVYVPAGNSITATVPSYLLAEPVFDKCVENSAAISEVFTPTLTRCQSVCSSALGRAREALSVCEAQFDEDEDRIADLVGHVAGLEATNTKLRHQRNVAWTIAGSLLAGSATAFIVASKLP